MNRSAVRRPTMVLILVSLTVSACGYQVTVEERSLEEKQKACWAAGGDFLTGRCVDGTGNDVPY